MEGYFIRSSNVTPSVYFNTQKGILDIRGRSCPENPISFYHRVFESIENYKNSGNDSIAVNVAFEYFNTSSSKCLYLLFKKLEDIYQLGKRVIVNWYFEIGDEDMQESGDDLTSFFKVPVNFVEIPEITILGEKRN